MTQWVAQIGELPILLLMGALGLVAILAAVGVGRPSTGLATFTAVLIGCLAGWSLSFLVGRRYSDRLRDSRVGGWIGEARWTAAEGILRRGGGRMMVVAPFLPVFNALLPLAAGGLRMSYRRFLGCATIGAAAWAGLYLALGTASRSVAGLLPGDPSPLLVTMGVGLVLASVAVLGARRRLFSVVG